MATVASAKAIGERKDSKKRVKLILLVTFMALILIISKALVDFTLGYVIGAIYAIALSYIVS